MTPDQRSALLDSLLDGDISESDFLRIEAELIVDPEVRQEYYRRLQLDLLLEREASRGGACCGPAIQATGIQARTHDVVGGHLACRRGKLADRGSSDSRHQRTERSCRGK
mgnify:CR=1 FL=1